MSSFDCYRFSRCEKDSILEHILLIATTNDYPSHMSQNSSKSHQPQVFLTKPKWYKDRYKRFEPMQESGKVRKTRNCWQKKCSWTPRKLSSGFKFLRHLGKFLGNLWNRLQFSKVCWARASWHRCPVDATPEMISAGRVWHSTPVPLRVMVLFTWLTFCDQRYTLPVTPCNVVWWHVPLISKFQKYPL